MGSAWQAPLLITNGETWPVRLTERKTLKPLDERPDEKVSVIIQLKIKASGRLSFLQADSLRDCLPTALVAVMDYLGR